jgi:hypothetical protein
MITRRVFGSVLVLVSILVLPYWIYIPVLFVAVAIFPFFWEGILLALFIDIIYGGGVESLSSFISLFSFYVLIFLIILLPIRERLRYYA